MSADLLELAQTPVVVVCAGVKAILDLPATLEYLETHDVPVLGFQTDELPAFYSTLVGIARAIPRGFGRKRQTSFVRIGNWATPRGVVCVPIPIEYEIPREVIEPYIERALREAEEQKITGNAITPFLLKRLAELTGGASVRTNVALLKNNVAVALKLPKPWSLDVPVA